MMKPCLSNNFSGGFLKLSVIWSYIPINAVQCFDLSLAAILLEVGVEVVLPCRCGDAVAHISSNVVLDIG